MAYEITFEKHANYIHATVTGDNSRESIQGYVRDLRDECARTDCVRVLIEERLEGPRMEAMEIFSILSDGSVQNLGFFEAVAFVDTQMGEMADFAETVAVNRGMPLAAFNSVSSAREWLLNQKSGSDEQYIFLDKDEANRD